MESRANHLHKSAQMLALSSPAISAYLGAQCNELASRMKEPLQTKFSGFCIACGTPLPDVKHVSLSHKPSMTLTGTKGLESISHADSNQLVTRCSHCFRISHSPRKHEKQLAGLIRKSEKEQRNSRSEVTLSEARNENSVIMPSSERASPLPTRVTKSKADGSSRQRAKARKHGLQAMLEKSKADAADSAARAGFGLDLMDLMKD
jgi:hypothetical protein